MNGPDLVALLRADHETELAGLGTSKALFALTDGAVDAATVHAVAIRELTAAESTFDAWASNESDELAADLFEMAAARVAEHRQAISQAASNTATVERWSESPSFSTTPGRLGGLFGWTLATEATADQIVNFFIGATDPEMAETYRDFRTDVKQLQDLTATTIADICVSDEAWSTAQQAASTVIGTADEAYRQRLERLDVDPDPR